MSVARLMQMAASGSAGAGPAPEVVGIENTVSASGTTPSLTLPSGISSGDVIVIFVGVDGTPTGSIAGFSTDIAAVGGWAASATYYVFSKTADGTEGSSVTLTLSASEVVCASAWVVTNADDISFSTTAKSTGSVNPDSPSLTSGFGTVPTLWLSSFATDNGTPTITSYPSGYENGQSLSGGSNFGSPRLGVASKLQTSASEDPPEYTISESHNWVAVTVAIGTPAPAEWTDPDLANASYDSVSFSVAGQQTAPRSLFFGSNGYKAYVTGNSPASVSEYSLSAAWDISTASHVQNFSVSTQDTVPTGVSFKTDGTKMYVTGATGDDVNEYSLSTAWDISTASYVQSFSVASQDTTPYNAVFKLDGTKMYVVGYVGNDINEYSLSTAWDISTASYVQSFSLASQSTGFTAVAFATDGSQMFALSNTSDTVFEYNLSTAWDISSASYSSISFSVSSQENSPSALAFKDDGSKMYIIGFTGDTIYQYSTA